MTDQAPMPQKSQSVEDVAEPDQKRDQREGQAMNFVKAIDAARAENSHGVQMRAGKKYTTVAVRVEIARRHFGAIGIATEVIQWAAADGQPVVVKATVTDQAGRILAAGHAEEVRGKGNVNRTSALENAETSAIGRAMAALGINGGEFASADEMAANQVGEAAPGSTRSQPQQPAEQPQKERDPVAIADAVIAAIGNRTTLDQLVALFGPDTKSSAACEWLAVESPEQSQRVADAKRAREAELGSAIDPSEIPF